MNPTCRAVTTVLLMLLVLKACGASETDLPVDASAKVGDLGDAARVSIEGAQTFTERDIRRALQCDLDYLVASHPDATLSQCLSTLEDRIRAGYLNSGFGKVAVQARVDKAIGKVIAKVVEGPRFRCGGLQASGLKSIPAADFTRRFAEKLAPLPRKGGPAPGLWDPGTPVNFSLDSLNTYSAAASNTFAALGRFAASFKVEIQPQPATGNAVLAVVVEDEGPAAVLRDIELTGNAKNSRNDVINFLGLAAGMPVTQNLIDEKALALTDSARFADSSITPTAPGFDGKVSLRVKVAEKDGLPPLKQPLSREGKALLRLRDRFLAWETRQEDLVIEWSPPATQRWGQQRVEAVVGPSGGIVARVIGNSDGEEKLRDLYSLVLTTDALSLFAQVHQRKLSIPVSKGYSGVIFVNLGACADCPSGFNLSFGAGLSPGQTNTAWQLRLNLLPAAFTDLLHRPGTEATWEGNVLTVRTEDLMLRLKEGTGELVELSAVKGKDVPNTSTSLPYRLAIRFATGAFVKATEEIGSGASSHAEAYRGQRSIGSALGFVAAEVAQAEPLWSSSASPIPFERQAAFASGMEKLLASSFLDPIQELLTRTEALRGDQEFMIPSRLMENQDPLREMFQKLLVWCAGHAHELAPADSWIQTLLRESAFTLNSRTAHTPAAFARLAESETIGPIGCYTALHTAVLSNPDWSATFCDLGLRRLSTEHFRRDYRILLSPDSVITRCLANLTRELGTLTEPELNAIVGLLPPEGAGVMRGMASATRKAKDLPTADLIGPALDQWWERTAQDSVEEAFRTHARQPSSGSSGQRPKVAAGWVYFPAGLAAVVNERGILNSQVRQRVSRAEEVLRRQYSKSPALLEQKVQALVEEALEDQINDELILAEALAAEREVSKEHLDRYIGSLIATNYQGDSGLFLETLAAQGTTVEEVRERHRQSDLVAASRQEKIASLPPPTPDQIEQYYSSNEKEFRVEESVKLAVIMITKKPADDAALQESRRKEAKAIHARLAAGADFATEAKLHSEGSLAQQGGDWGWTERSVLRKELADAAFSLKTGGLSDVIETEPAWFILRVADHRPQTLRPLAEVTDEIDKTLRARQRAAVENEWLAKLRTRAFVRYVSEVSTAPAQLLSRIVAVEVKHIGLATVSDTQIRSQLAVKEDEPVCQALVDRDIRTLYATGDFDNIQVSAETLAGGTILRYVVHERPLLMGLQFKGNKRIGSPEMLPKLASKTGNRIDERKLFFDSQAIQRLYEQTGFRTPSVKYVLSLEPETGRGRVTFKISEGSN